MTKWLSKSVVNLGEIKRSVVNVIKLFLVANLENGEFSQI